MKANLHFFARFGATALLARREPSNALASKKKTETWVKALTSHVTSVKQVSKGDPCSAIAT